MRLQLTQTCGKSGQQVALSRPEWWLAGGWTLGTGGICSRSARGISDSPGLAVEHGKPVITSLSLSPHNHNTKQTPCACSILDKEFQDFN